MSPSHYLILFLCHICEFSFFVSLRIYIQSHTIYSLSTHQHCPREEILNLCLSTSFLISLPSHSWLTILIFIAICVNRIIEENKDNRATQYDLDGKTALDLVLEEEIFANDNITPKVVFRLFADLFDEIYGKRWEQTNRRHEIRGDSQWNQVLFDDVNTWGGRWNVVLYHPLYYHSPSLSF